MPAPADGRRRSSAVPSQGSTSTRTASSSPSRSWKTASEARWAASCGGHLRAKALPSVGRALTNISTRLPLSVKNTLVARGVLQSPASRLPTYAGGKTQGIVDFGFEEVARVSGRAGPALDIPSRLTRIQRILPHARRGPCGRGDDPAWHPAGHCLHQPGRTLRRHMYRMIPRALPAGSSCAWSAPRAGSTSSAGRVDRADSSWSMAPRAAPPIPRWSGGPISSAEELERELDRLEQQGREGQPFIVELVEPNAGSLGIGLGGDQSVAASQPAPTESRRTTSAPGTGAVSASSSSSMRGNGPSSGPSRPSPPSAPARPCTASF